MIQQVENMTWIVLKRSKTETNKQNPKFIFSEDEVNTMRSQLCDSYNQKSHQNHCKTSNKNLPSKRKSTYTHKSYTVFRCFNWTKGQIQGNRIYTGPREGQATGCNLGAIIRHHLRTKVYLVLPDNYPPHHHQCKHRGNLGIARHQESRTKVWRGERPPASCTRPSEMEVRPCILRAATL